MKRFFSSNFASLLLSPRLHIPLLLGLTWMCWGATLRDYFLSDDFFEIGYVYKIFHGYPDLILENLLGPYLQKSAQLVYRPGMLMSQVFDYAIWGPQALGFHLSNLLYYSGNVVLLYLLIRQIPGANRGTFITAAAFFSAALFALSPLHCESVAWIIGRVDNDCCFYYLLSFVLLLYSARNNNIFCHVAGLISLAIALCTKEMAIGLPVVLTCALFLFQQNEPERTNSKGILIRLTGAFALSWGAWAVLVGFFIVRTLALGTFPGGYQGSVGDLQNSVIFAQWTDPDTWKLVLMPFSKALAPQSEPYAQLMEYSLWSLGTIMLVLAVARSVSLRWLIFIFVWMVTTTAPVLRWWELGEYLQAARFHYFFTMPLSALAPVLIFTSFVRSDKRRVATLQKKLLVLTLVPLTVLVFTLGWACYHTNQLWIAAGEEVRSVRRQALLLVASHPGKRIILLGLPETRFGVHEIENPQIFNAMMRPPFSKQLTDRFIVFLPLIFLPSRYIDAATLRHALADSGNVGPYLWNYSKQEFELVSLHLPVASNNLALLPSKYEMYTPAPGNSSIHSELGTLLPVQRLILRPWCAGSFGSRPHVPRLVIEGDTAKTIEMEDGAGLYIKDLHLNPLLSDYIEFEYRNTSGHDDIPCRVAWNVPADSTVSPATRDIHGTRKSTDRTCLPSSSDKYSQATFKLSGYWRYFTAPEINSLFILFDSPQNMEIRKLHLYSEQLVQPEIEVTNHSLDSHAAYQVDHKGLDLHIIPSPQAAKCAIQIEISKPNFVFAQQVHTKNIIGKVISLPPGITSCHISLTSFPGGIGIEQLRAACVGATGEIVGKRSDPINIMRTCDI